jgi:YD repeat-containing protein
VPFCQRWTTTVALAGVGNYVYQEDTKGRLAALVNPFSRTFSLGYDLDGKNTLVAFPNGVQGSRLYTTRDWLSQVQISQPNGTIADTFSYLYTDASNVYDPTGHLRREVDAGNRTHAFFYDHRYELVQETHPDFGTNSYAYDVNGNRTSKTSSLGVDYYGVDANNKLLWVNRATNAAPTAGQTNPYALCGYDLNGNMTSRDRRYDGGLRRQYTFFWDGDDRLRTAQESGVTRL